MAKKKSEKKPMTAVAEEVETHIVKTVIESPVLDRIRVMMANRKTTILSWLHDLAVRDLEEWEKKQKR